MSPEQPSLREFSDLLNATSFTHSWLPAQSFPVGDATLAERQRLRSVVGIEVHFDSPFADEHGFVKDFVLGEANPCFLYAAEPTSGPRSRIRSYKGLFVRNGKIRAGEHVECEVPLSGNYSHFVGMAKVTRSNFKECTRWFRDGERSFLLSSNREGVLSEQFAKAILVEYGPPLPGHTYVDYLRLVLARCTNGDRIYRMGGYSGDGDADFQIFVSTQDSQSVRDALKSRVHRAAIP